MRLFLATSTMHEAEGTRSLTTWESQKLVNLGRWHLELDFQFD